MEAFIFDAVRTPRGKGKKDGSLHGTTPLELAATALRAADVLGSLASELEEEDELAPPIQWARGRGGTGSWRGPLPPPSHTRVAGFLSQEATRLRLLARAWQEQQHEHV